MWEETKNPTDISHRFFLPLVSYFHSLITKYINRQGNLNMNNKLIYRFSSETKLDTLRTTYLCLQSHVTGRFSVELDWKYLLGISQDYETVFLIPQVALKCQFSAWHGRFVTTTPNSNTVLGALSSSRVTHCWMDAPQRIVTVDQTELPN